MPVAQGMRSGLPGSSHALLNLKGFQALQAYRIAHALWRNDRSELAFALTNQSESCPSFEMDQML